VAYNLDDFGRQVQRRPPLAQAQARFHPIRNQARQAGVVLESARPPAPIARLWAEVWQNLDTITDLLGLSGDFVIAPDQPVLIDPPGFEHFPWPIRPPGPVGPPPALPLVDQAIGELEAYLVAIQPNLASIPEGPRFHRDARDLRDALLALRQPLAAGAWDPGAAQRFARVEADTRRLVDRTVRVSRGQIGPNNARVLRVRDLVDQIGRLLPTF